MRDERLPRGMAMEVLSAEREDIGFWFDLFGRLNRMISKTLPAY